MHRTNPGPEYYQPVAQGMMSQYEIDRRDELERVRSLPTPMDKALEQQIVIHPRPKMRPITESDTGKRWKCYGTHGSFEGHTFGGTYLRYKKAYLKSKEFTPSPR